MSQEKLKKIDKFESTSRLKEIDIAGSFELLGFSDNMTLADIGSGTGLVVFEASKYKNSKVYSLEMSDTMIEIQEDRIKQRKIENVEIVKQDVDENKILIDDNTCDVVTMFTVFHEIEDKIYIIREIKRILKSKGKLLIVEFHDKDTGFGPPLDERLSKEDIDKVCSKEGFTMTEEDILGENFYRLIFEK